MRLDPSYRNIFLTGMPGAGKSYWAEQIAAAYALQCIDMDHIISVRTGMRIARFFDRFGEHSFRDLERQTLGQVMEVFPRNTVVACGGGTPCFYDNMTKMKRNGTVIYLEAPLELLVERLETENDQRPLLDRSDWKTQIQTLLDEREAKYRQADVVLSAKSLSVADFAPYIANALL